MPVCAFSNDTTAAAYAATDDKKLQEPYGDTTPTRSLCTRLAEIYSSLSLRSLSCLGSLWWSFPLAIASPFLTIAWYVIVPFYIDPATMAAKYAFTPMSESGYIGWGIALLTIIPIIIMPHFGVLCGGAGTGARWGMFILSFIYVVLLVVGNSMGKGQESKRLAFKPQFTVKFNEYYCDSRMLLVCLEGNDDELLVLMGKNTTTESNSSTLDATLSIWTQCRKVIANAMGRSHKDEYDSAGNLKIEAGPINRFVKDVGVSSEVDAWCTNVLHRETPTVTDEEQRMLPAPFAQKPEMFEKYTREWSRRLYYSNVLLGTSVGCMVLAAWSWKIREMSEEKYW